MCVLSFTESRNLSLFLAINMPVAMMHPSQTSVMKPKPVSKHQAGSHPQWMRTLEEKYQKLHKKIVENTNLMNLKYNHSRSFHDMRLTRYRDSNTAKSNTKPNNKRSCTPSHLSAHNGNSGETQIENISNVDMNGNCLQNVEAEQSIEKIVPQVINETGNEMDDVLENVDNHSYASSVSVHATTNQEVGILNPARVENVVNLDNQRDNVDENIDNLNSTIQFEDRHEIYGKIETVFDENKSGRNLKTAFSRISRNTAKSCPAQIQARAKVRQKSTTQGLALRSKSAHKNSDMFDKMSKEAHHAITETVREMNATRSKTNFAPEYTVNNGVRFCPSRSRKSVRTWAMPKQDSRKITAVYDTTKVLQNASNKMQQLIDSNMDLVHHNSSANSSRMHESIRSSRCSSADFGKRRSPKLPDIQSEFSKDKINSKCQLIRLPGIGNYDVPVLKDGTFEITPPGFDSRYNDLQPVEERESETPPPDIRQRAIDKCSEWLTKYSSK